MFSCPTNSYSLYKFAELYKFKYIHFTCEVRTRSVILILVAHVWHSEFEINYFNCIFYSLDLHQYSENKILKINIFHKLAGNVFNYAYQAAIDSAYFNALSIRITNTMTPIGGVSTPTLLISQVIKYHNIVILTSYYFIQRHTDNDRLMC